MLADSSHRASHLTIVRRVVPLDFQLLWEAGTDHVGGNSAEPEDRAAFRMTFFAQLVCTLAVLDGV